MIDGMQAPDRKSPARVRHERITRKNRAAVIFLVADLLPTTRFPVFTRRFRRQQRLAELIDPVNYAIDNLLLRSMAGEHVRNYFQFGCYAYQSRQSKMQVFDLLWLENDKHSLRSASTMLNNARPVKERTNVEDGAAYDPDRYWIDRDHPIERRGAVSPNDIEKTIERWWAHCPNSYVFLFHLTDARSIDPGAIAFLRKLRDDSHDCGEFLVINMVRDEDADVPFEFPSTSDSLPYEPSWKILMDEASLLPAGLATLMNLSQDATPSVRAFCLAATEKEMGSFIDRVCESLPIGTLQAWNENFSLRQDRDRENAMKKMAERRAKNSERRARRAEILAILSVAIAGITLLAKLVE